MADVLLHTSALLCNATYNPEPEHSMDTHTCHMPQQIERPATAIRLQAKGNKLLNAQTAYDCAISCSVSGATPVV